MARIVYCFGAFVVCMRLKALFLFVKTNKLRSK